MSDPRAFWNERYSTEGWAFGDQPNDFLREAAGGLSGPVLCLGEGEGRNAVFLAGLGLDVTAVDLASQGVEKTRQLAAARGVHVRAIEADLADFDLGVEKWGAVVSIWCHLSTAIRQDVHRRALASLKPGGKFVLEAYTPRQLEFKTGGPPVIEMLYEPEALRSDMTGCRIERLQELQREVHEGRHHHGISAVVQVVAVKPV